MSYRYFASGYLIQDRKVLLVHHKGFNKWTPPGGHIEDEETAAEAVVREWKEETGLDVEVVPAHPSAFAGDDNATPIPMPFHIDLEREGFEVPHVGHFFYVRLLNPTQSMVAEEAEVHDVRWFSEEELAEVPTFDQVRALAKYAIEHYPNNEGA